MLDVAQTGGHKKRVRRSSFLNAKKLYEDAQMARKVKQNLSNLELEMDEESLQTLSLQCEPATNTREFLLKVAAGPAGTQIGFLWSTAGQGAGAHGILRHASLSYNYSIQRSPGLGLMSTGVSVETTTP